MRARYAAIVVLLIFMMGSGATYAVLRLEKSIPVYGVVALGDAYYFLSGDGTSPLTTLPFTLNVDGTYSAAMYVVNKGKTMSAAIAWDNPSWAEAAPSDLTITWDLSTTIPPNSERLVHVTMRVNRVLNPGATVREFNYRLIVVGNVAEIIGG